MVLQTATSSDSSLTPTTDMDSCKIEQIPREILKSILERLDDLFDIVQAKVVCSSWNLLGDEIMVSNYMPLLILHDGEDDKDNKGIYNAFFKPGATRICRMKRVTSELRDYCCIGSSRGWIVFLGKVGLVMLLFHPFRQVKIQLPSLACYASNIYPYSYLSVQHIQSESHTYIKKVILMKEPDRDNKNYSVILLCPRGNIVHHRSGHNGWEEVVGSNIDWPDDGYEDINLSSGYEAGDVYLFALSKTGTRIDGWYFHDDGSFRKGVSMSTSGQPSCLDLSGYDIKLYLVESCGDMLLVARLLIITETSLKTSLFHVFKLAPDNVGELFKWVEMDSLGDRALFVGGNQSTSVCVSTQSFSSCQRNSIYYTDDLLDNGNDMGVYNFNQRRVNPIDQFSATRPLLPTPCWVLPPN